MNRGIGLSVAVVCLFAGLVSCEINEFLTYVAEEQTIDKAPYTVQLRNKAGTIVCAGSLITFQHVLTAANCFDDYKPADITIVAAATRKSETGVQRQIGTLFKHDSYNPTTFHNDVAVIKLESPLEKTENIDVIELCSTPWTRMPDFNDYSISGWLTTDQEKFHIIRIPLIGKEDCEKVYKEKDIKTEFTSSMVCNEPGHRFACTHVPGSAAETYEHVCAFNVGGPNCADSSFTGFYTNVNEVRAFIEKSLKA